DPSRNGGFRACYVASGSTDAARVARARSGAAVDGDATSDRCGIDGEIREVATCSAASGATSGDRRAAIDGDPTRNVAGVNRDITGGAACSGGTVGASTGNAASTAAVNGE